MNTYLLTTIILVEIIILVFQYLNIGTQKVTVYSFNLPLFKSEKTEIEDNHNSLLYKCPTCKSKVPVEIKGMKKNSRFKFIYSLQCLQCSTEFIEE